MDIYKRQVTGKRAINLCPPLRDKTVTWIYLSGEASSRSSIAFEKA